MATEKTLHITTLGRHGEGIAEGGPVYVPFTLPGETVRAAIEGRRGRLVEVVEPSPARIEPHCPHFARCGGCAVQHWREADYLDWKREFVETALRHRRLDAPVAKTIDAHGDGRRRVTLHVRFARGRVLAGFMAARSHNLLDLDACPILAPELRDTPGIARALATPLAGLGKPLDMAMTATDSGIDCDIRGRVPFEPDRQLALSEAATAMDLARLSLNGEPMIERRRPMLRAGIATIALPPGAFTQATALGEEVLARLVLEGIGTALRSSASLRSTRDARKVADLFCGVGPFALRLAARVAVLAVDNDAAALKALDQAARAAPDLKPPTIETRDLFRRPLTAKELARFGAVVFDPPRAGAEAQAGALAASKVPVVVAVSCDPATFARDAAILTAGGYRIETVTPIDQFRHAGHVEIVGVFRRR